MPVIQRIPGMTRGEHCDSADGAAQAAQSKWTLGIREEPREANFPEGPGGLRDAPSR